MNSPHTPSNRDKSVEIFAIGNELLVGQVLDTNTHWLIRSITSIGAHVSRTAMIRDDYDAIGDELTAAVKRAPRLILTTGGLGPTDDDLTLRAISHAFDLPLREDAQALEWIRRRYEYLATIRPNFSAELNASRKKMALFPINATPIYNGAGAAPAMFLPLGKTALVSLPGVPTEMKEIFATSLQPVLADTIGAGGYIERTIVLDKGDESRIAVVLAEVQQLNPLVYIKSRGQNLEDGLRLTVVVSLGGNDLVEIRSTVKQTEAVLMDGLTKLGYSALRVIGDAV
jgi:molybdenum cofactor synthesis domain-containing protein